jgi:PAS domain-containing protein
MRVSFVRHLLSLAALALAILLRAALDPILGAEFPLVTLFGAVAAAVWLSGPGPALAVALAGYAASAFLFMLPRGTIGFPSSAHATGLAAHLFTSGVIIVLGERMRRTQDRARDEREAMRVTLQSIGDAVITTDVEGRITFLNAVAEATTGWTQADASGKPLDAIFRIVNEDTRAPVENPAHRALREGVVVLVALTIAPFATGLFGAFYLAAALLLGGIFLILAIRLARAPSRPAALRLYLSSLAYLALLFTAMAIDRAV